MAERSGVIVIKSAQGACERDLLEACEATFNIDLPDDEAGALRTVGDLYSVIRWKCQRPDLGPSASAIAESYRQLRTHVHGSGVSRPIRPTSALEPLFGADPRPAWAGLRKQFGKGLPRLELSDGQLLFVSMLVATGLAGGVFGGLGASDATHHPMVGVITGLVVLAVTILAVMAYSLLFARSIPVGLKSMADLARLVASLGTRRQPPRGPAALWEVLEDVLRRDGGFEGAMTASSAVDLSKKASPR